MSGAPRLEIDLAKIYHNAHTLVKRLRQCGISVTGVTKATLGSPGIAKVLLRAGVTALGDSRIENIESMCRANIDSNMILIRSPMLTNVSKVIHFADISFNTEIEVIRQLSIYAQKTDHIHKVLLMVELGDLREGIMPDDLLKIARETCSLPNIILEGIGTNLACRSGVAPDENNMATLTELANMIEASTSQSLNMISGGNSANLAWAFSGADIGRVNNLRLGESILLGRETLHRKAITNLHTDAITLTAEVIESKLKPTKPLGNIGQTAFGAKTAANNRGTTRQAILAIGIQDVDPEGLQEETGVKICGASSDHLMIESTNDNIAVGSEVTFQPNYAALLRIMTSPFVEKRLLHQNS